jgi:N utilization substance protein A
VVSVEVLDDDVKSCRVVVPDDQLSLAIGKEGQNARLAAKLTGYKIDIKSVTAAEQESQLGEDDLLLEEDTAEESIPAETAAEESAPVEEVSPAEPEAEQE